MRTELGSSQVEVQRYALSWAARRLTSSTLSWAVGEELGDELARLARRKWRVEQGGSGGGRGGGEEEGEEDS